MKEITLEVPEGKRAEWINGVLTLVDEQKVDKRPIIERIKTFKDAYDELGHNHPLCEEYYQVVNLDCKVSKELIAYLKLRIIATALNEGWEPLFIVDEERYYPWFWLCTKKEYDNMNDEKKKQRCVFRSGTGKEVDYGLMYVYAFYDSSYSSSNLGSRLALKTGELAEYAGKQFIDIYKDFMFSNELYTHN